MRTSAQTAPLLFDELNYFASIFDKFDDFIAIIDIDTKTIAYINNVVLKLFDVASKSDIIGKPIPDFRKESLTKEKIDEIFHTVLCGNIHREEAEYKSKSGKEFLGILKVLKIEIHSKEYILYKITDITEIKKIEVQNNIMNQRLRFAIEGNGDGLWEWHVPSNETYFSKRWKEMLGFADHEIQNNFNSWVKLIHPDDLQATDTSVKKYLANFKDELYDVEFRMLCKNGNYKWINARGMVVKSDEYDNPIKFVGTHSDIDKLKNVQKDLEVYTKRLEKSNADVKQFAYITTHDLKEPLRAISNNIQLLRLKNSTQLNQESINLIDYSVEGCKKLMGIIKELLDYAQLDIGVEEREYIDMGSIINNVVDNLELYIKSKNTEVIIKNLPEVIYVNKPHFLRLIQNLISNAIKYNDKSTPQITIDSFAKNNKYIISIKDNGMGIAKDFESKIYEIFKRLKTESNSESVGMGLAVCKKIVESHNGSLWHESELGVGTTFFFSVPIVKI